uniref:Lipid-binding serum glycoprotein N-terminal domain-containing protein n=1 Tax=Graphocephala atropunctata TaxID=36148 RepID=A0A1B6KNH8_9HEMI
MSDITGTLWFLLLAAMGTVWADTHFFNDEMDGFLGQFREDIYRADNSEYPLPNVRAQYLKQVLFLKFQSDVNLTEGTFRDMTSIRRTGNTSIVTAKENFLFRTEFGFDELRIEYNYEAKLIGIPFYGIMDMKIDNSSIYLELLVNLTSNRCSGNVVTIRNMRITLLNGITFNVTGFSIINPWVSRWLTHTFTNVSVGVKASIEEALRNFFTANLKEFDICEFGVVPENLPFDDTDTSEGFTLQDDEGTNNTSNDIRMDPVLS